MTFHSHLPTEYKTAEDLRTLRSLLRQWDGHQSKIFQFMIHVNMHISFPYFQSTILKSTHICGIKGCGGAGCPPPPPPIIFERLKLPQQIIYRRKENLSESPNHQKNWENILVSRFYEQFSRNRRNLGHFRKFKKISNS